MTKGIINENMYPFLPGKLGLDDRNTYHTIPKRSHQDLSHMEFVLKNIKQEPGMTALAPDSINEKKPSQPGLHQRAPEIEAYKSNFEVSVAQQPKRTNNGQSYQPHQVNSCPTNRMNDLQGASYLPSRVDNQHMSYQSDYQDHYQMASAPRQDHLQHQMASAPRQDHLQHQMASAPKQDHLQHQMASAPRQDHLQHQMASAPRQDHLQHQMASAPRQDHLQFQMASAPRQDHLQSQMASAPRQDHLQHQMASAPRRDHLQYQIDSAPRQDHLQFQMASAPRQDHLQYQMASAPQDHLQSQMASAQRQAHQQMASSQRQDHLQSMHYSEKPDHLVRQHQSMNPVHQAIPERHHSMRRKPSFDSNMDFVPSHQYQHEVPVTESCQGKNQS